MSLTLASENSLCSSLKRVHSKSPGFYETIRREMRLRNYSLKTIKSYLSCLRSFVGYIHPKHPRDVLEGDIREYLLYLIEKKPAKAGSASSVNQAFNSLRFLYVELYKTPFVIGSIPRPKKKRKLPDILSQEEVLEIMNAIDNLKQKTLVMLTQVYHISP